MAVGHAEAEIERAFAGDSDLLCGVIAAGVDTISRPDRSIDRVASHCVSIWIGVHSMNP